MSNKARKDQRKRLETIASAPQKKPRQMSVSVPEVVAPVRLSEIQISRRPTSTLPSLIEKISENLKALLDGEALPIRNTSPSQRTQIIRMLKDKQEVFSFGYNKDEQILYVWKE